MVRTRRVSAARSRRSSLSNSAGRALVRPDRSASSSAGSITSRKRGRTASPRPKPARRAGSAARMGRTRRLRNNSATRSQSPLPSSGARRPPLVESQAGWVAEPVSPTTHFNQDSNYGRRRFAGVGLRKEIYDLRGYDAPGGNPAWAPYLAGPKTSAAARIIQHAVRRHQQRRRNRRSAVQQAREATLTGRGRTWNARPAKKDVRYPARQPVTRAQSAHRLANDRRKMDGIVKIRRADTREQVNRWVLGQIIQDAAHDVAVFGGPEWQSHHDHWQGELDKEIASAARDRQEGAVLIAASARRADQRRAGRIRRVVRR